MTKSTINEWILPILILGFVIALGVYFALAPQAPDLSYRPIDVGGGSIEVGGQESLDSVTLSAELAAPGFITIHESMSGAPAAIIGTSDYLEQGKHETIRITLTQNMLPGYSYITLLHADNGDKVYVTEEDLPVMTSGAVVRPDFVAQPSETKIDLPGSDISIPVPDRE